MFRETPKKLMPLECDGLNSLRQLPASCVPVAQHCYHWAGEIHGTSLFANRLISRGYIDTRSSIPATAGPLNLSQRKYRE